MVVKMIKKTRILLVAAYLILECLNMNSALAHDQEGNLTAAGGESATDIYSITCSADPAEKPEKNYHLFATLRNNSKEGGKMSMLVYKNTTKGGLSKSATDNTGGDYETSPAINLPGGDGEYLLFVHHQDNTPQTYLLQFHCQDSQNQHTDTNIQTLQNE
jgi:hypothetical protein